MIVYDLTCQSGGHRFEGWFGSSQDFAEQQARGLVTCPVCGTSDVAKAVMAPNIGRKGNQVPAPVTPSASASVSAPAPLPPQAAAVLRALAQVQAEALRQSTWVGDSFAADARAMHYGEKDAALIHGQATPDEARALIEEGVEIAPILFPVAPPGEVN